MTKILSHHDHVFKKFLGDIAVARDFLEIHLPPHLRKRCDFGTLAMASGSFIEDDLKGQCSYMLYSMKTTTGHDGYGRDSDLLMIVYVHVNKSGLFMLQLSVTDVTQQPEIAEVRHKQSAMH